MGTMRRTAVQVTHKHRHNLVPHNEEADELAKVGAQMSVVHKSWRCRSAEGQQRVNKHKVVRGRGSRDCKLRTPALRTVSSQAEASVDASGKGRLNCLTRSHTSVKD